MNGKAKGVNAPPPPPSAVQAASPIELTSEDEPPRRSSKPKSKPNSAKKKRPKLPPSEVIDLCSDAEDLSRPPRPTQRTKTTQAWAPPREEDVIVLLSSDNEDRLGPSRFYGRATLPNRVQHSFPPTSTQAKASQLPVKRFRREEEEEEEEEVSTNGNPVPRVHPPPRKRLRRPSDSLSPLSVVESRRTPRPSTPRDSSRRPSASLSPVPVEESGQASSCSTPQALPSVPAYEPQKIPSPPYKEVESDHLQETEQQQPKQPPSPRQIRHEVVEPSSEVEETTEPLQNIYNNFFQSTPSPESSPASCRAFSFKIRLPPHPATVVQFEAFDFNSPPPPLLTSSFFKRAIGALPPRPESRTTKPMLPTQSLSRSTSSKPSSGPANSGSTSVPMAHQAKSQISSPLPLDQVEAKDVQCSNVQMSQAPSPAAEATDERVASHVETGSQLSTPRRQSSQNHTQALSAEEAAVPTVIVPVKDSTLGSGSQKVQPKLQAFTPRPQTSPAHVHKMVSEEGQTDSTPERSRPVDEVAHQVMSSEGLDSVQAPSPRSLSASNRPEYMRASEYTEKGSMANKSTERVSSTSRIYQQADFEPPLASQPEVVTANSKVAIPDAESTHLLVSSPKPAPSSIPISLTRPYTAMVEIPVKSHPEAKETTCTPAVKSSSETTIPSPSHPPPLEPINPSSGKMDNGDDATVSPLYSSRSDSTNDNDMQEIAEMLFSTSSGENSSEPTDEELLVIGLCYPDFDE